MAGHADNTFGRQDHCGRTQFISLGVTPFARAFIPAQNHLMHSQGSADRPIRPPDHPTGLRIFYRPNPFKMAGAARNPHMGVVGHFFVMGKMAIATVAHHLRRVRELSGAGMTDCAGGLGMGRGRIILFIDQRDLQTRQLLSFGPGLRMAVKTEFLNLVRALRIFEVDPAMAGHASLILTRGLAKGRSRLMACPTLFVTGFAWFEFPHAVVSEPALGMGFVAADTIRICLTIFDNFGAMDPFIQVGGHLIMAGQACFRVKEVGPFFGDIHGIGMKPLPLFVVMAVHAGCLPMGRDMDLPGIDQPGGFTVPGTGQDA
jgi:hypothetical protein